MFDYEIDENGPPIWTSLTMRGEELIQVILQSDLDIKVKPGKTLTCGIWMR